jgi:hypothetical protein
MAPFARIAEQLVADKIIGASAALTGRNEAGRALAAASGFFGIVGLGFFLYAAHLWLADRYSPEMVAALTGALFVGAGLAIALVAYGIVSYKRSVIRRMQADIRHMIAEALECVDEFLTEPVNDNPKTAALAATLAGLAVGRQLL